MNVYVKTDRMNGITNLFYLKAKETENFIFLRKLSSKIVKNINIAITLVEPNLEDNTGDVIKISKKHFGLFDLYDKEKNYLNDSGYQFWSKEDTQKWKEFKLA